VTVTLPFVLPIGQTADTLEVVAVEDDGSTNNLHNSVLTIDSSHGLLSFPVSGFTRFGAISVPLFTTPDGGNGGGTTGTTTSSSSSSGTTTTTTTSTSTSTGSSGSPTTTTSTSSGGSTGTSSTSSGGAGAALTASPSSLSWGALDQAAGVDVGTRGPVQLVTLSNSGSVPSGLLSVSITGGSKSPFSLSSDGCTGVSLPPATSCSVSLVFAPLVPSMGISDSLIFQSGDDMIQVHLLGVAGWAGLVVSPLSSPDQISVGAAPQGAAATPFVITLSNPGSIPVDSIDAQLQSNGLPAIPRSFRISS